MAELSEREGEKDWDLHHLCDNCARELGLPHPKLGDALLVLPPIPLFSTKGSDLACEACGLRFNDFRRAGRVGCEKCYDSFAEPLEEILQKAHAGQSRHVGRGPGASGEVACRRDELAALHRRLKTAIATEAYEEAARLRDLIRGFEEESTPASDASP